LRPVRQLGKTAGAEKRCCRRQNWHSVGGRKSSL
jgi:hypothetical protein